MVVTKLDERWYDYVDVIKGCRGTVDGVRPYTGGTVVSPLYIIAYSLYEEYGIMAAEFEDCLRLPQGAVSHFPFPQTEHGWFRRWTSKLLSPFEFS